MGSLTAKTTGEIASFMSPSVTNIKSLKVHFSPKQLGTGDPSPENVREIEGWDGIKIQFYNPITNLYVAKEQTISIFGLTFHVSEQNQNITINGTASGVEGRRVNLFAIDGDNSTVFCSGFPKLTGKLSWSLLLDNDIIVDSLQDINGFSYQVETNKKLRFGIKIYSGEILSLDIHPIITKTSPISVDFNNTFYGGYIDLISGELVETCVLEEYTSNDTWQEGTASSQIMYQVRKKNIPTGAAFVSNLITRVTSIGSSMNNVGYAGGTYLNIKMTSVTTLEDFLTLLESNPLQIAYTLATPVTHQLTPTQLQSFVGQNNFWSNADYVEVEYDLIETVDIQKAKQKIILNQPQLKTISDKVVSFNTDMLAPIKNCKIYFKPIQLGSGDPSPTNVKNINGWTSIDSYINGDKISVDWTSEAGTVYGGYLDLAKKEVVAEWESIDLSTLSMTTRYTGDTNKTVSIKLPKKYTSYPDNQYKNIYCSKYNLIRSVSGVGSLTSPDDNEIGWYKYKNASYPQSDIVYFVILKDDNLTGTFVYAPVEPIHYPLSSFTPQQLLTLKSTNYIWSETNGQQIDVTYWTRKNLTSTPLTNYLENQTWTDSAYISSSGKKTTNTVSASHFLTNQILLEAGTYVLSGFSYYVGTDNTNYRIHAYDSTGKWLRQITYKQIGNLSPVDISFTLNTDTYVNVSIAADFDGVLAKIN